MLAIIWILVCIISIILLCITTGNGVLYMILRIQHKETIHSITRLFKYSKYTVIMIILGIVLIIISQQIAYTPAILDTKGNVLEGSIAELRQVVLNGRKEWISIRGHSKDKPLLLFLAGGPGGTQLAATRHELAALEEHFLVVNWEQPGSGKSYTAVKKETLTPTMYIEDGTALVQYLLQEFDQEKIYLVGESWGSALGIFLVNEAPELYHAFIGTGQMVDFLETERIDYELAMKIAHEKEDTTLLKKLLTNGAPPYYGDDVTWKSATYLKYLSSHMAKNPAIHNASYHTFRDIFSNEYGILDSIHYFKGIITTFNTVYPQLYHVDLRTDYSNLEVPIYFFLGRHDINAPTSLVEEYFDLLQAPKKEIVWFEHSGHSPWINENKKFIQEVMRVTNQQN